MKTFGYVKKKINSQGLLEMREVTFTGSAASVREVGKFFLSAAEQMEQKGVHFSHLHINEYFPKWLEKWPDVIVARSG